MKNIDTIIHASWVVPVEPDCEARENYSVAIDGGRIVDVLPQSEVTEQYQAKEIIDRPGHVILPGLVNAHTHAAMSLLRGLADDIPLMDWLQGHIWPAEGKWVNESFAADGTTLAVAEMLKSGITCFSDMYYFPDITARTASQLGMRICAGIIVIDFPTVWADSVDAYFEKGLALRETFAADPLVSVAMAPHAPYTVSDAPLSRVVGLADELDLRIHVHLHETADEVQNSEKQYNERPIERFRRLGLMSSRLTAVHMTQLTDAEIALAAEAEISVVHCPESNLKLASGLCPVAGLLDAGINVALGTDGAASNNDLDMIGEMRTAALIGKHATGSATSLPTRDVLRMATLNGARAFGLDSEIGSLVPGKWADIVCIDLGRLSTQPVYDPVSQIVYAAARDQVADVWVAGQHLVSEGQLTQADEKEIVAKAREWQKRIHGTDPA